MAVIALPNNVTVTHHEMPGSPVESQDGQGFTATRNVRCAWADRLTLMTEILGTAVSAGGNIVEYTRPQKYPHRNLATARTVKIRPYFPPTIKKDTASQQPQGEVAKYDEAQLEITYTTLDDESDPGQIPGDEQFVTERLEPAAEFITMPKDGVFWNFVPEEGETNVLDSVEAPGKLVQSLTWVYSRNLVPILDADMFSMAGKVNELAITSATLGITFPAETLLYEPGTFSRRFLADESTAWSIELRFTYRENTWQKAWNPKQQKWQQFATKDEDGNLVPMPIYEKADLRRITVAS